MTDVLVWSAAIVVRWFALGVGIGAGLVVAMRLWELYDLWQLRNRWP